MKLHYVFCLLFFCLSVSPIKHLTWNKNLQKNKNWCEHSPTFCSKSQRSRSPDTINLWWMMLILHITHIYMNSWVDSHIRCCQHHLVLIVDCCFDVASRRLRQSKRMMIPSGWLTGWSTACFTSWNSLPISSSSGFLSTGSSRYIWHMTAIYFVGWLCLFRIFVSDDTYTPCIPSYCRNSITWNNSAFSYFYQAVLINVLVQIGTDQVLGSKDEKSCWHWPNGLRHLLAIYLASSLNCPLQ